MNENLIVNSKQLGKCFGLTERRINQLAKEGKIPTVSTDPNRFSLPDVIQAYIQNISDSKEDDPLKKAQIRKLNQDREYRRIKTEQERLRLDELKGDLHRSEHVERAITETVLETKAGIQSIKHRLENHFSHKLGIDVSVCRNEIEQVTNELLDDLANRKYKKEDFAEYLKEEITESEDDL